MFPKELISLMSAQYIKIFKVGYLVLKIFSKLSHK